MRRLRAFSLPELLIAMLIVGILGGVLVTALWIFVSGYFQSEDLVSNRMEIEDVFQHMSPIITNAGLGMPNNRKESGSFSASFKGADNDNPIMAFMGDINRSDTSWGGPICVTTSVDVSSGADADPDNDRIFVGRVLYCAWGIPTGVKIRPGIRDVAGNPRDIFEGPVDTVASQDRAYWSSDTNPLVLTTLKADDLTTLTNFSYEHNNLGIQPTENGGSTENLRSWILFPSLRIPMLLNKAESVIEEGNTRGKLTVRLAPYSWQGYGVNDRVLLGGGINGYEEIHLVQAARFYVNGNHEFIRETFSTGTTVENRNRTVLARNIAAVCFRFDMTNRLLTLYVAARGTEAVPRTGAGIPPTWPSGVAPVSDYFTAQDQHRRITVESMTWRIRN